MISQIATALALSGWALAQTQALDPLGPAAFDWPPDRPWTASADNSAPCGSREGPVNRTEFPLTNGKVTIFAQEPSYMMRLSMTLIDDPDENTDFFELVTEGTMQGLEPGASRCVAFDYLPSGVLRPGRNATFQMMYIAQNALQQEEYFYACADVTLVNEIAFDDAGMDEACGRDDEEPIQGWSSTEDQDSGILPPEDDDDDDEQSGSQDGGGGGGGDGGMTSAQTAGVVVGVIVGVVALGVAGLCLYRRREKKRSLESQRRTSRGVKWTYGEDEVKTGPSIRMRNLGSP